jgi:hypothetical protein
VGRERKLHQRAAQADWRVGSGVVVVTPLVGDAVELHGTSAVVWAVLDMPRTAEEVFSEALQIDPLLDVADVRSALDQMVEQSLVWRSGDDAAVGDIAI